MEIAFPKTIVLMVMARTEIPLGCPVGEFLCDTSFLQMDGCDLHVPRSPL